MFRLLLWLSLVSGLVGLAFAPLAAQDTAIPPATIQNDEGGPIRITGEVSYTNVFFTDGVAEPLVILEDQAGFVDRDVNFIMPTASQVLGQITSDFFTSPFTYSISLPIEPAASLRDVDQDGEEDRGVMVYAVAYWNNVYGDPYLEQRDLYGGGWSNAYVSTRLSSQIETLNEIVGGVLLVYAPEAGQGFPSGFGEDSLLFTEDDPIVALPAGYTVVNLDEDPFTFDRSREATIDLIEGEGAELHDFSDLPYDEAFDAMIEHMSTRYAFSELKGVDWETISAEHRPAFVTFAEDSAQATELRQQAEERAELAETLLSEAEDEALSEEEVAALQTAAETLQSKADDLLAEADDLDTATDVAYQRALMGYTWAIDDGHHGSSAFDIQGFQYETAGGLGIAIRELDDGRVIVNYNGEGEPAHEAGVELGAEIIAINGQPIADVIVENVPWSSPFSTEHTRRLQQLRYVTRFPLGESVTLTFRNPEAEEVDEVTLEPSGERDSFRFSSFNVGLTGFELPLEYELLEDSGFVYAKIHTFSDNDLLQVQLWERLMNALNSEGIPGLIIDMRQNGGGSGFLGDQMTGYFFDEPLELEQGWSYDEEAGEFVTDDRFQSQMYLPPEELRYHGAIAVLIGPHCSSACEYFSHHITSSDRGVAVGQYPTGGLGGPQERFLMPGDEIVQFSVVRPIGPDGEIVIEGVGVIPDVWVPVNEETLFSEGDPILEVAIAHLEEITSLEIIDGGSIAAGESVSGTLSPGQRVHYSFDSGEGGVFDLRLYDEAGELDTVLSILDTEENVLLANDDLDDLNSGFLGLEIPPAFPLILEVSSARDEGEGNYTLSVQFSEESDE
ncbi:MAG: S41 family peptidase [Chloroflexi bacterium]|nr:S41 family peptidase [Chloroflexota bacterium]